MYICTMIRSIYRVIPSGYRGKTLFVAITILVRALLNFIGVAMLLPVLMLIVGGDIENNQYMHHLYELLGLSTHGFVSVVCGVVVCVLVLKNILNQLLYHAERNYISQIYQHLSRKLFVGYYQRGLGFFKRSNSAHLARDVNAVSMMFTSGVLKPIAQIVGDAILLIVMFAALSLYSLRLALFALLIFVPIAVLFYAVVRRKLSEVGRRENELQRTKSRIVLETFRGYADVKIGGAMPHMLNNFDLAMTEIVDVRNRQASIAMLPQAFVEIGLVIGLVAIALWGGSSSGDLQLMFGVFAVAAIRLLPVIRNMMSAWSTLRYNSYSIDVLNNITVDDYCDVATTSKRMDMNSCIELRDISFRYDDAANDTISHLSMTITKGERVGIRGASGVGKTTLFNIILGLYRPTSGTIVVDDVELTDANISEWQNSVGYVSQNVFITDGSLVENIAFGIDSKDIDYNLINEVISQADLMALVDSLPDGINSRIGELGARLSGGQRQRIGIARALYKRCKVLMFDEATSSLDAKSESNINSAISKLSAENKGITIIVIAHRESSLEYCNRIITLE